MIKLSSKNAFTLAEVLITLPVIGVIAAVTLPSLVNNTNSSEMVTKVKKYQAILNQVFKQYATDNRCIGNLASCGIFEGTGVEESA